MTDYELFIRKIYKIRLKKSYNFSRHANFLRFTCISIVVSLDEEDALGIIVLLPKELIVYDLSSSSVSQ